MTRLYDRSFALIFVCQVSFVLGNVMMAHYARWIEWLGGSVREVGWIMGAGAVAGVVLRPWMGQWINRLGARRTWALGLMIFIAGTLGNLARGGSRIPPLTDQRDDRRQNVFLRLLGFLCLPAEWLWLRHCSSASPSTFSE